MYDKSLISQIVFDLNIAINVTMLKLCNKHKVYNLQ